MYATFQARAEAVSAEVKRFADRALAVEHVLELLRAEGVGGPCGATAVWSDRGFLAAAEHDALIARVPGLAFEVTRERAAKARVGVSQVDYAVAETGSLAVAADAVEERLVSTLPEVHVALADPDHLVPNLSALWEVLEPLRIRYLSLITGPSRTADIERVLTIGVHGPRRLVIVFVDGMAGRS